VLDGSDACPLEAGPAEEQGCPIRDADKDSIPDSKDKCPDKPETFNGIEDEDGCPDAKAMVVVTETEVKILEKVLFATGKADIMPKSFPLLDTVAAVLNAYPMLSRIEVQGHTDDVGNDDDNLKLSAARAEAVKSYLEGKQVKRSRLGSAGYGETTPLCPDAPALLKKGKKAKKPLEACREQNRRVQFKIIEINGKPIEGAESVRVETSEE
jgi:outer membrane protein OmpA-like peptidoglycan-associated protein